MRVLIKCLLAGFLVVFAVGCAPPGQRLLRIRIEQDGSQIAEGIRGVSDSATVDEMWAIVDEVPFQLQSERADAKPGDTLPVTGPVTVRILHVENELAKAEVTDLSLVRDEANEAWRITSEQSDPLRLSSDLPR